MANPEAALRALYEDPSLREDLTDDEAAALLEWGAQQVTALAAETSAEPDFDARMLAFRALLTGIGRYIGLLAYAPPETAQAALEAALAAAPAAGFALTPNAEAQAQQAETGASGPAVVSSLTAALRRFTPPTALPDPNSPDWSPALDEDIP